MPAAVAIADRLSFNPAAGTGRAVTALRSRLEIVSEGDDLVERCRAGEAEAFRELFRQHRNDVARLVHRMLGPSSDVEDVIQEVFLQVHRSVRDFRGQARFSTWLYRVTVNVVLMHRRAARSRPVFSDVPEGFSVTDARPLPDDQVARRSRMRAFERLLDRLSEKKRTVFILHELEGMAPADIANVVGAPVLTVRTRLFYARRELAEMLREEPTLAALADDMAAPRQKSTRQRPRKKEAT
jgi:RNA polymerase sigma-70 factor (ECF subfamily)